MYPISFELRYQYPSRVEGIFLPVTLRIGQETVSINAAVDTGASFCLFSRSVAEAIGIDVESGLPQTFASAAGHVEAFGHPVQLTVFDMNVEAVVFFFASGNIQKNLLGRRGWLDRILFGVDEYQQTVYLLQK